MKHRRLTIPAAIALVAIAPTVFAATIAQSGSAVGGGENPRINGAGRLERQ